MYKRQVGKSFIKSYAAVCLEGAVIVLACIIFSLFASSPPVVNPAAAAVTMVWSYIGELVFNMLVLVGAVKMADRVVRRPVTKPSLLNSSAGETIEFANPVIGTSVPAPAYFAMLSYTP